MLSFDNSGSFVIIGGSCHKYHFCRDKSFVVIKDVFCSSKHVFVAPKVSVLWRQNYVCRAKNMFDKHTFVATKDVFCRNKHVFVATNMCFSRQRFCRDKNDTCGSSRQ